MFRCSKKRVRVVSTVLAAAFIGLWLVVAAAPCVAAASTHDKPCAPNHSTPERALPCAQASAPCELPSFNSPTAGAFDFSITPVVLATLPADVLATNVVRAPPEKWQATRPPSTPLYLTHLALLN